jgi:predicted nucleotidyltransferase
VTSAMVTPLERNVLIKALASFADTISSVGVFGSRATGIARENSDIDLVIYGDLDSRSERRLWTILEDSNLSVPVDLVVYSRINNPLLKEHIDAVGTQLFTHEELAREKNTSPHLDGSTGL